MLSDWWRQNEVLLVCLCDEASGSSALLAVRKTPMSVRLYEARATQYIRVVISCVRVHGMRSWFHIRITMIMSCIMSVIQVGSTARDFISWHLLLLLEQHEGASLEVPPQMNCALVATEELTAHYIEAEMREVLGETRGNLGWAPRRMDDVAKGHLTGLRQSFEKPRKTWCADKHATEAKRKQATEAIVARVLCNEERRKAFEARWLE